MNKRPTSITIVSWFLIVTGVISLVAPLITYGNPEVSKLMDLSSVPVPIQYLMMIVGVTIILYSGIGMLLGKKFARTLYVSWTPLALIYALATSPVKILIAPSLLFFLIIVFFLFRKNSNAYFNFSDEVKTSDS